MVRFVSVLLRGAAILSLAFSVATAQPETTATLTAPDADTYTTADVLDSLLSQLQTDLQGNDGYVADNPYGFAANERPRYPAAVVQERLNKLNFVVPMDYNPVIQSYIDMYTYKYPNALSRLQGLSKAYFPIIEEILDREGVPQEIKYLCIVESAMNPYARSWAGAVGLWQFMLGTARLYDLRVDSYIDERHDPVKSTEAAARYLKDLYRMYNNWHMALAAYNCGPGRLNRAIRASGGKTTFWEISEYLPKETRGYVPAFIGAAYAMSYAAEHNVYPGPTPINFLQDHITIHRQRLDLRTLANETGTDLEVLRKLNPELRLGIVPYSERPYDLRVPQSTALAVMERRRAAAEGTNLATAQQRPTPAATTSGQPANTTVVFHTLAQGERLSEVAAQYRVTVEQIIEWNNLQGYTAQVGHRLKIYAPLSSSGFQGAVQGEAPSAAPSTAPQTRAAEERPAARPSTSSAARAQYYTVRSGDSLWGIASRHNLEITKLCELNGLSRNARLRVGQRLRVR